MNASNSSNIDRVAAHVDAGHAALTSGMIKLLVDGIPGVNGHWRDGGRETYRRLAGELLAAGMPPVAAACLLAEAYAAAQPEVVPVSATAL